MNSLLLIKQPFNLGWQIFKMTVPGMRRHALLAQSDVGPPVSVAARKTSSNFEI
jgi:hypothetical protein